MSDFMEGGECVRMNSPVPSPVHSPTLHRAALRALMATVGDLTISVAQSNVQQAQNNQHMHAVSDFLALKTLEGGMRHEFHGEPARFYGSGDVKAWSQTLELFFDAEGLNTEKRFLHTIPLLAKSALKFYEDSHPTSYAQLCAMLTQRISDKHDRFHRFSQLAALRQGAWGLDAYMERFLEYRSGKPPTSCISHYRVLRLAPV